ncbi:CRISPR-associated helicase Cas3' [Cellulomonas hominis]
MDREYQGTSPAAVTWAKSWPHNAAIEEWLPLWQHLDDTADVAGKLWDEWLAPVVRGRIGAALPDGEDDGRRLVTWLAGVHDIGKATPAFAIQVGTLADRMSRHGLRCGPIVMKDRAQLRHELAGAAIIGRWLDQQGVGDRTSGPITAVIAGHHGSFPQQVDVTSAWRAQSHLIGDDAWQAVQTDLVRRSAERAGSLSRLSDWHEVLLPQPVQMLLAGIVVLADWVASSSEFFRLRPVDDVPPVPGPDPALNRERLAVGWKAADFGPRWAPQLPGLPVEDWFRDRFPFPRAAGGPRDVQRAAAELATTMRAPGMMFIEAPMGVGKTEAAFLAVEALAARTGCTGCFVALPTQATSNAMFDRTLRWLARLPDPEGTGAQSVALVHGKSALNATYSSLRFNRSGPTPVYDEDLHLGGPRAAVPRQQRLRAAVTEWMTGRKRAALSSFAVGTIDQVLFDALVARHVMLRHLSLAGKVVVIDEVHAADVYMSTFLDRALEWLAASGTPVVLMSATLPARRRAELYWAYERGRLRFHGRAVPRGDEVPDGIASSLAGDIGYPSIVTTGDTHPTVATLPSTGRGTEIVMQRLDDRLEALGDTLERDLRDGGCAVVIRNTVRRVQETAEYLLSRFGPDEVLVTHARFLAADRSENDEELLRLFGPAGEGVERPHRCVVVASQVVEQSLDVDFDVMVTDLAPVDLVLQRMGRLHRHRRGLGESDRPEPVRVPRCYVTGADWAVEPPRPVRGSTYVYAPWLLYRSMLVLGDRLDGGTVSLPEDIALLVQKAYGDELDAPRSWEATLASAAAARDEATAVSATRARAFALPGVRRDGIPLYGLSRLGVGAVDEDSPQGQACVRDSGESLEVVVVQRGGDGVDRTPGWLGTHGGEDLPLRHVVVPHDQARVLATCTVRLPMALTRPGMIDAVIHELEQDYFEGWAGSHFLSGQLPLVLDENGHRTLAGHVVTYDRRYGLQVAEEQSR